MCVYVTRQFNKKEAFALIAILLTETVFDISEAMAYYYRGNETEIGYIMVRVTNFTVFFCGYILAMFVFKYMSELIKNRGGNVKKFFSRIIYSLGFSAIVLLIMSRIFDFYYAFDEHNRYYRLNESYPMMIGIGLIILLTLFILTLKNRQIFQKAEFIAFSLIETAPMIGLIIQLKYYGYSIFNLVNTIMILLLFMVYEINYGAALVRREREIAEERLRMYQGQIHPHFIFNSLSVIRSLLPGKSEAKDALDQFSRFLRGSLDNMIEKECIMVSEEIKTVESYLKLQERRFGKNLEIELEIFDDNFLLPTFTIQTLVENAITHGIREKSDGLGKLKIKMYETDCEHIIEVIDDGVGFDVKILYESNKNHVGLKNLQERLKMMCNGELEIKSEKNNGTVAKVHIPKKMS